MKKIIAISIVATMMGVALLGCNKANGDEVSSIASTESFINKDSMGQKYKDAFLASDATTPNAVADQVMAAVENEMTLAKMDVAPGFLNGFDGEINGFKSGVQFSPMIGSIPFVAFVFETDDPNALRGELSDKANMRWNVCTAADEMVIEVKDNLVFFIMCSNED